MTKPLDTHLSQREAAQPRAARRPRTWLVALLGFGAADLLVLNLWAVPSLLTNTTTTDIRAAQSGDIGEPEAQPQAAAVAQRAELAAPERAPVAEQHDSPAAQGAQQAEAVDDAPAGEQGEANDGAATHKSAEAQQPATAPDATLAARQPPAAAMPPAPAAGQVALGDQAAAAQAPSDPAAARDDWAARAPRAEAPPGGAPPAPKEVADVPSDPAVARAFAIRAAQRAVRVALQDRSAFPDNGPFDALTVADQPLTQIFFSLGNFALGPNGKQLLERKLPMLTSDQRPILVVGAADPSGPEQVNEKLSDARAQSVAQWLLAHGVDAQRIQTHAIGHEGAVGSTLDRRVDIWLGGSR